MARTVKVDFRPHPGQLRFLKSKARKKLASTGVGGGKSAVGAIEALYLALANPGLPAMVVSPTYDMLRLNTVPPVERYWPQGVILNPGALRGSNKAFDLHLSNGSTLHFRSADNPDNLRGPNLAWAWLDEAGQMARYAWDILLGRVRVPCPKPAIILTTTPRGFTWLYNVFVVSKPDDSYELIHWDSRENSENLIAGYHDQLIAAYSPAMVRQEVYGEFVNISAATFLRYDTVLSAEREQLPHWPKDRRVPLYMGIDVGRKHDLTVITVLYLQGDTLYVAALKRLHNVPFGEQIAVVKNMLGSVTQCNIDSTGIGCQMAEELTSYAGQAVEGVNFTMNSKADMAARLRKLFDRGLLRIPKDPALRLALLSVETHVSDKGIVRLMASSNEDGHADEFWSLALAVRAAGTMSEVVLDFVGSGPQDSLDRADAIVW